jgi:antitoxin component of MazEF toxin-antitoxin module
MKKKLTPVGNSKAVILPADMIRKYKLTEGEVIIEETERGILIRPSEQASPFAKALDLLRKKKYEVYRRMEAEANDPATHAHYASRDLDDLDTEIYDS